MKRISLYNKFAEIFIDKKMNEIWTGKKDDAVRGMIKFIHNNYRRRKHKPYIRKNKNIIFLFLGHPLDQEDNCKICGCSKFAINYFKWSCKKGK